MYETRLENVDLNLIVALYWLLEEGGVSKAAGRVGITQPAMSRTLERLRTTFGDPLLVRSGRTMVATEYARTLQPELARVIGSLRTLIRKPQGFDPETSEATFRIACSDYLGFILASAWYRSVAPLAPKANLVITALNPDAPRVLAAGHLDAVVLPDQVLARVADHIDVEGLVQRELFVERFVTVVRGTHPLAGKRISWKQFAALDHVLVSPEGQGPGAIDEILAARHLQRRIAYRVNSFALAPPLIEKTDCVGTLPEHFVDSISTRLKRIHLPKVIPGFTVLAGWLPYQTVNPVHRWIRARVFGAFDKS